MASAGVSGSPGERRRSGQNDFRTAFRTSVLPLIRCATKVDGSCREAQTLHSDLGIGALRAAGRCLHERGKGILWWRNGTPYP